ncbi:MAG: glycosyltransferase family 39 protein, partial [Acidobacteria bacterium]|nr:glycosyltransferase family 39 protein [Acidobacteriota bacterium]
MTRQDRRWLLGLLLGGLGLRLLHLATIRTSPFFLYLGLDPLAYHEWALRIADGNWLGDRVFYQDPLYPYFLGLLYTLLGDHRVAVTLVQLVLGALVPLLVYDATRRGLGRAAAPAAGLLAAAYLPAIYFEGLILKTWLGAALAALALWCMACALTSPGKRRLGWLSTGMALGLGCLVRGNLLLILPVLIIWRLAAPFLKGESPQPAAGRRLSFWRRLNVADALALLLGATLVLFPTAVRNRVVGGEWVLTTAQGGPNFYLGNNPVNTTGRYATLPFV